MTNEKITTTLKRNPLQKNTIIAYACTENQTMFLELFIEK